MKYLIALAIAIMFILYGIISIFNPAKIRDRLNKSHQTGLTDFGAGGAFAEAYVKRNITQHTLFYRIIGFIALLFSGLFLFAVIREMLS